MKFRKVFASLSIGVAAFTVLGLTSCQNDVTKPDFIMPEALDTESKIEIEFWSTMGKTVLPVLQEQIAEFNKIYPNITVKTEVPGAYADVKDQIVKQFSTGDYPTMAYCYPDHVALYNEAEITVSLDDLASNSKYGFNGSELVTAFNEVDAVPVKEDEMIPAFYAEGKQYANGKMYTLPFLKSTEVMFYNVDFFKEHNLTVPTTWEEMWTTCAAIKAIDANSIPLGYDSSDNLFITLAETYGYDYTSTSTYFDFNNEGMRSLVKTFREKYDAKYFITKGLNDNAYTSNVFKDSTLANRMYMCIGSSAGASNQVAKNGAFEVGVAAIPRAASGQQKAMSQGPSLVFFKNEDPQKVLASWIFAQFLLTDYSQASFATATGYMPVTKTATEIDAYKDQMKNANGYDGLPYRTINFANNQSETYFSSPVFIGSSIAREEVGSLFDQVMADATINSSNINDSIQAYFDAAIKKCKYESGLN